MLKAISPIDGRYQNKTKELSPFFSEEALFKYRVLVEVRYFIALCRIPLPPLNDFPADKFAVLSAFAESFNRNEALQIQAIEKITNHDVKAVEYYLKDFFDNKNLSPFKEFIHFGLTSQDINNTALPMLLKDAVKIVYLPLLEKLLNKMKGRAKEWAAVPLLARTHGQAASPTLLGKELMVFIERLENQIEWLNQLPFKAKFGGATGNFNAHLVAYPDIDWLNFADEFVQNDLGLERSHFTTQIAHYDHMAAIFQNIKRINTILIDFCRDIWTYISMDYFKQKVVAGEVGSSAMPHKVNPIDFENAEGNLGMANALFTFFADKLPVSRLQRDLTDSTVTRNIGVPFAHTIISMKAILKGLDKLLLNSQKINKDLSDNWIVTAEAIQTVLRREAYPEPYEALKLLTRGNTQITQQSMHDFINQLNINDTIKQELKQITPFNYTGIC